MTHQEQGWFSGNLSGFDFPDLNGGSPGFNFNYLGVEGDEPEVGELGEPRPMYLALRAAFGVESVINDWSANPELNVGTDWVITIPGQYVMLDLPEYVRSDKFNPDNKGKCLPGVPFDDVGEFDFDPDFIDNGFGCDQRDIPVTATFLIFDREEQLVTADSDRGVVVSPSIPGQLPTTELRNEVNVIHWGDRPVMSSQYDITVDTSALEEVAGWSNLKVTSKKDFSDFTQSICMWRVPGFDPREGAGDPNDWMACTVPTFETTPPMIGFVAWERSFPENPDGNYGRAVKHSFETGSVSIFDEIDEAL
jgi:hypothetical protein